VRFPHNTRLAGAALALALLVGCGDTVGGTPTPPDGGATGESTEPTETSESAETTEPSETSESDPDTGELVCEGENVIAPEGQPFCFDLPQGFQQGEIDIDTQAGSSASYTTGILLSELDLVIFSVYELDLDSDDATDQQLIDALAALIDDLAAQGFEFTDTEPQLLEVDGARTFYYSGSDASGLRSDLYFIFRGLIELQVNCQWETMETEVLAGCEQVLDSLQVSG